MIDSTTRPWRASIERRGTPIESHQKTSEVGKCSDEGQVNVSCNPAHFDGGVKKLRTSDSETIAQFGK